MTNVFTEKETQVWEYLVRNRKATAEEVAEKLGLDRAFILQMFSRISSKNWREDVPANSKQVGGSHYKDMALQPWAVMESLLTPEEFIGFLKGNVIKYSLRQGKKDSDDAGKAKHYIAKLKEMQGSI
jgi:hypothetical protein|tara:strand:+ start:52 stop:432 length:381 start_codon:yes stop_codon:yes gene_type:complete